MPADLVPGARHAVVPKGIASTGWPRVKGTCRNIGWRFDPWQDATGRLILAKNADGRWAADLSILSIPRQVGKSYLLGCIIFALCLLNPKLRVIWTSHHTATTEEMYEAMKELASHKRVAPHVVKCIALQGSRWRIQFRNGSRIDFGARSQGFGRGKAKVGVLVLDEFQHITSRALANLAPTTNQAENPLILCAGTPPGRELSGEAFTMRRTAALEGFSDDTLYVEFSADENADPDDRRQWAKANPSFPKRTPERAFLLLRKVLDPEDFTREALGIWDANLTAAAIPPGVWAAAGDKTSQIDGGGALAVSMSLDNSTVSLVSVGRRLDGGWHVEVVEHGPKNGLYGPDSLDFVGRVAQVATKQGWSVWLHPNHPVGSLLTDLEKVCNVEKLNGTDYAQACGMFFIEVTEGRLHYPAPQPELTAAVEAASQKKSGDAWRWDGDGITALVAATHALHGASNELAPNIW